MRKLNDPILCEQDRRAWHWPYAGGRFQIAQVDAVAHASRPGLHAQASVVRVLFKASVMGIRRRRRQDSCRTSLLPLSTMHANTVCFTKQL